MKKILSNYRRRPIKDRKTLVNQFKSEKEAMIKEFRDTLNSQDEAIEELQYLNAALSRSFEAAKEIHKQYVIVLIIL